MKNEWLQYIRGYVIVKIVGTAPERLINQCLREGITIWNIRRLNGETIVCSIELKSVRALRPLLRKTNCKIEFIERRGVPFIVTWMGKRAGFTAGIVSFILIIFALSNIVWNIEIYGGSPKVEQELQQLLTKMGIKRGAVQFLLPDVEIIQRDVTEQLDGVTWVGVRQKGTTYEFEIVEQQLPEEAERLSPRHLVATKKAIIHDIFVKHGEAVVEPNDFVNKGDLLVSGYIGKEGKKVIVPAEAVVLGEIWYKSDVSISLETLFTTLTGEKQTTHYVTFHEFSLPIWGFYRDEVIPAKEFETRKPLYFFKWKLPIEYKRIDRYEASEFQREYTEEQAIQLALERAREDLLKHLPKEAKIIGEKVLHEAVENGKVNLQIHYQVIEDITSEQPIVQGE